MLETLSSILASLITSVIESSGYLAVFVLMTLESVLIPIPSEITMPFAGFLVSLGRLNFFLVILTGAFANLTGSLAAYGLGSLGKERVHILVRKYGKFLLISVSEIERAEKWFRTYGEIIAFGSRLLPVVRTFISLPAGMARMNIYKFAVYSFLGSLIWSSILTYIGVILGNNWQALEPMFRKFQFVLIGALILVFAWYIWHKVKKVNV